MDNVQMSGRGCLVMMAMIGILFFCFYAAFTPSIIFEMPNETDLNSDKFRKLAEDQAEKFIISEQEKAWESIGFSSAKGEKTYKVWTGYGAGWYVPGDIAERTKYYQGGTYQVITATETRLSSTSPDGKTTQDRLRVQHQFIVTLSATPKRKLYGIVDMNWKLVDIQLVKMNPDIEKINDVINNWKIPASKKANW